MYLSLYEHTAHYYLIDLTRFHSFR